MINLVSIKTCFTLIVWPRSDFYRLFLTFPIDAFLPFLFNKCVNDSIYIDHRLVTRFQMLNDVGKFGLWQSSIVMRVLNDKAFWCVLKVSAISDIYQELLWQRAYFKFLLCVEKLFFIRFIRKHQNKCQYILELTTNQSQLSGITWIDLNASSCAFEMNFTRLLWFIHQNAAEANAKLLLNRNSFFWKFILALQHHSV